MVDLKKARKLSADLKGWKHNLPYLDAVVVILGDRVTELETKLENERSSLLCEIQDLKHKI